MVYKQNNNSIMQNSMMLLTFFISYWKYYFSENLVQKIKIISSSWNLVSEHVEFNGDALFFCFSLKIPFSDKFSPESQNY